MYDVSEMLSLRLPDALAQRLDRVAKRTHRTKSYYVRELIEEHIDRLEWESEILAEMEGVHSGKVKTRPLSELIAELGITREELNAAAAELNATD